MFTNKPTSNDTDDSHKKPSLPLSYLPDDVRHLELYPRSSLRVLGLLAQTSQQYEIETAFLRLLPSLVGAEPESYEQKDETRLAAIAILKRHPAFLFEEIMLMDHAKRKINVSPYRFFLGAGDPWAIKQVHEEIVAKIEDQKDRAQAEAETKAEFQAQFPNCSWPIDPKNMSEETLYDNRNKEQIAKVTVQLKIIVEKIASDPCTHGKATKANTTKAIADLHQIFVPKEREVIKTGLHFPLGILKEIVRVYHAQFDSWSSSKVAFFSREVIGGALAALSAVDGQCVKNGLVALNYEKGPDRRDGLFCRRPKGIPEDKAPLVGQLGRTMFVDPIDGLSCFLSLRKGYFDWYNKKGECCRGMGARLIHAQIVWLWRELICLERTKIDAYGKIYNAAVDKEINTLSRGA